MDDWEASDEKLGYKIRQVQKELKRPGGDFLKFGGFRFRSCKDILQYMQPALEKYNLSLQLKTEYKSLEGKFQVDDIAIVTDRDTGEKLEIVCKDHVREIKTPADVPTDRKNKYCCGLKMALMCVLGGEVELEEDDWQEQETANFDNEQQKMIISVQCQLLEKTAKRKGLTTLESVLDYYKVDSVSQLTEKNYIDAMSRLQGMKDIC